MTPVRSNHLVGFMREYLFCTVCTILSVLMASAIWIFWQDLGSSETLNRERSQEFESMLSTMVSGPLIRQELAHAEEAVQRIESNLVVEAKAEENLHYFYQIQKKTQAIVPYLRQGAGEILNENSDYKVIPYSIQLAGTYEQVAAYLQELETGSRLVQIRSFSFRRRDLGMNTLSVNLELRLLGKR